MARGKSTSILGIKRGELVNKTRFIEIAPLLPISKVEFFEELKRRGVTRIDQGNNFF